MAVPGKPRRTRRHDERGERDERRRQRRNLRLITMFRSAFLGECPNCVFGHLFEGAFRPRARCDTCGMDFEPDGSTWNGTTYLVHLWTLAVVIVEGVVLGIAFGLFDGFAIVLSVSAVAVAIVSYRPVRGWWVWCLWTLGYLG